MSAWRYTIYHEDGTVDAQGPLPHDTVKAIVELYGMAERGENGWEYEMRDLERELGTLSFKRTALGVRFEKVGMLHLPPLPPLPGLVTRGE